MLEAVTLHKVGGMTALAAIESATANGPFCLGTLGKAPLSGQVFLLLYNVNQVNQILSSNCVLSFSIACTFSFQLRVGYEADILGLQENPLEDIYRIADPDNISHIWKGGQLIKQLS